MSEHPTAVEAYARKRMAAGELLTWSYDHQLQRVTFFIPDDSDESNYPAAIDGIRVLLRKLPRAVHLSAG